MAGFTRESYIELADRLVDALQDVALSPELGQELLKVLDTVVKNVRTIDFNNLTMVHYEAFMELRTTLMNMNVDVEKLVEAFDEIARVVQKRYWQFKTGGWPEMEWFVEKLLESMETDEFWTRVQQQYDRLIPALEKMYKPYEKTLIDWIVTKLRPFEVKAVEYLETFAEEIGTTKLTIVDDIRKFNTTEMLYNVSKKVIDTVTEKLSNMCDGKEKGLPVFILQRFGLGDHADKITKTREALEHIFTEGWSEKEMTHVKEVKKEFDELIKRTNILIRKCPK